MIKFEKKIVRGQFLVNLWPFMTVSGNRWQLHEQGFLFNRCGFLRTQYCMHWRIKIVFYWIAGGVILISSVVYKSVGDNYWSVMLSTNLRCLQICGVTYQSGGVNYWSADKIKMLKKYSKKVLSQIFFASSSRYNDLTFYENIFSPLPNPILDNIFNN